MKLALQSIVGVLDAQTNFCDNLFNHPPYNIIHKVGGTR